jgi:hypothetical protein
MAEPFNLFDLLGEGGRTVRDTSREAYRDVRASLAARERVVLEGLRAYLAERGEAPTAYELFKFMEARGEARDLNSVRPRLTEMQGRAVVCGPKRKCGVTGKKAHTWTLVQAG